MEFPNGEKYITWRTLIVWVIPSLFALAVFLGGLNLWLLDQHAKVPHNNSVTYREFLRMRDDVRDIKIELRELRRIQPRSAESLQ